MRPDKVNLQINTLYIPPPPPWHPAARESRASGFLYIVKFILTFIFKRIDYKYSRHHSNATATPGRRPPQ